MLLLIFILLFPVSCHADFPYDDVTPPSVNITSFADGKMTVEATDDYSVDHVEIQKYPNMVSVCAYDPAGNMGVESRTFHTPPGTVITLTATVSYWQIYHVNGWYNYIYVVKEFSNDLIVVSPLYKETPYYCPRTTTLMNGMLRRVILKDLTTVDGIQTIDGDLFVDGAIINKTEF